MSRPGGTRRVRIAVAAAVSIALLVPLGIFGGTGFAQSSAPAASQYKITICHHTHSKKHPLVTIRISIRAWPAHQRHGDTMGACPGTTKGNHGKHSSQNSSKHEDQSSHESQSSHEDHSSNSDSGKAHGHEKSDNPSQPQGRPQTGNAGATNGQSQSQHDQSGEHGHGK